MCTRCPGCARAAVGVHMSRSRLHSVAHLALRGSTQVLSPVALLTKKSFCESERTQEHMDMAPAPPLAHACPLLTLLLLDLRVNVAAGTALLLASVLLAASLVDQPDQRSAQRTFSAVR